ncbi:MAG: hypothetical protein E7479_05915 [Ruminococcaceae bacterium]|nr:hypothetical protein [Oscillospiraceae bacterium]
MANFIEELYYGNIEPQNVKKKKSKSYSREMKILSENEDILLEKLPEEDKKLFLEYVDAWGIVDGESVVDSSLPDSDLEQSLHTILLYLLNRIY